MLNEFIAIRPELHQIPETGYKELKTQAYLLDYISKLPSEHLEVKKWRTGILVLVKGTNPEKTIGYRTDIDALPITEETGLPFASKHPGNMHACGHDLHMSIALGVLTHFASKPAKDNLLFVFQPAEEVQVVQNPSWKALNLPSGDRIAFMGFISHQNTKSEKLQLSQVYFLRIHRNFLFRLKEKVDTRRILIWRMIWLSQQVRLLGKCKRL